MGRMAATGNGASGRFGLLRMGRLGRRIARPYLMREIAPSSRIRLPIQYLNRRWYFWFWIVLTLACLAAKPRPALAAAGPIFAVNTGDSIERTRPGVSGSLTTNQRDIGFSRTFNDSEDATGEDGTEIGAFEVQPAAPTPTPIPSTFGNISTGLNVRNRRQCFDRRIHRQRQPTEGSPYSRARAVLLCPVTLADPY